MFDRDNLPDQAEFGTYRKTAVTRLAGPYPPPVEVETREGTLCNSTEACFIALDEDGWPYPVAESIVARTYEPAVLELD